MSYPVFYVPAGDVLPVFFDTFAGATGASITMTGLAVTDIEIYKDGSVTQRASDAGYVLLDTDGIDFDALTGIHGFSIDTGDNTDAGFYTVGAWFTVVVSAVTVDAQTVSFIAAQFRLMKAEGVAGVPKADVDSLLGTAWLTPGVAGTPDVNVKLWNNLTTVALPLVPTTAGRTLDVAATGEAGLDFNNVLSSALVTLNSLTITGATTFTGTTVHTGNVSYADGVTIAAPSTLNRSGLPITGNGTGDGIEANAGATGHGIQANTTAGNEIDANITGNLVGTVSTLTTYTGNTPQTGDVFPLASTEIADIKTKTDFLPSATAGAAGGLFIAGANAATSITTALTANVIGNITGNLSGSVGSVTGLTAANLDTTVSSRASPAQVNTEVLDVLNVDTFVEPVQGAPVATTTLVNKIGYLYKFLRNKVTQTSTTLSIYNDDAVTVDHKATVSDDATTYTRGEIATGP